MRVNVISQKRYLFNMFFIALTFLLMGSSPSAPWSDNCTGTDSSVFRYIGYVMCNGQFPYKDVFDHKGPLLYFINAFGYWIDPHYGIWIVEFVFMLITLYVCYKTLLLFDINGTMCLVCVTLGFLLLQVYFQGGNFTEEYALPFISFAQYFLLDFLIRKKTSYYKVFIIGICMAQTLMLRPNMIGIWIADCLVVIFVLIKSGEIKNCFIYGTDLIAGVIAGVLPYVLWMSAIGIVDDFVECFLVFNFEYAAVREHGFLSMFWFFFLEGREYLSLIVSISLLYLAYCWRRKYDRKFFAAYMGIFLSLIVSAFLICYPGNGYLHYGMVIIPILPLMLCMNYKLFRILIPDAIKAKLAFVLFLLIVGNSMLLYTYSVMQEVYVDMRTGSSSRDRGIVQAIMNNTDREDKIWIIGNNCELYLDTERETISRFIYQSPVLVREEYGWQMENDFMKDKPKVVVYTAARPYVVEALPESITGYIEDNYVQCYSDDEFTAYLLKEKEQ